MVYTDFKNNLYSSVSHITFTHRLRFVDRILIFILQYVLAELYY